MTDRPVLWKPNPGKQTEALRRIEFEVLYGGRRGGGKTDAGIAWLLYDIDYPLYRALIIRKNAKDLADWIDRAMRIYSKMGAEYRQQAGEIAFPSGAIFRLGHLKDDNAYGRYQGHEYHKILIEELTQIPTEINYLMLIASCRTTIPQLKPQIFCTCNPDGPGFYWVKKRWRLEGVPLDIIVTKDDQTGLLRVFVPAGISDNPFLDNDPTYKAQLNGLPDGLRQAWKDGSWSDPVIEGAYYTRELLQARKENRIGLVPHDPALRVHPVFDLGIDDTMSVGLWQRNATQTRIIDYYEGSGYGIDHYVAKLQEFQREKSYAYGKWFMPHDANKRELQTGKTLPQYLEKLGIKVEVVPMLRIEDGIQRVRLMFPRLLINESNDRVLQFLSAIQNYRHEWDEKLLKYKDNELHDWASHAAAMLRYTATIEERMTNSDFSNAGQKQFPSQLARLQRLKERR